MIDQRQPKDIVGVNVFAETLKARIYVGFLTKDQDNFVFSYDEKYLHKKNIIPLGLEFPLTKKEFVSKELFPSFADRIPDPDGASYMEYCTSVGIAVSTTNPIVLLAKFKRGPSSFVFEPVYKNKYSYEDIKKIKDALGVSLQDIAHIFGISLSSLQKIKKGDSSGKEVLRLIELYLEVPKALEFQIQRNAKYLHPKKAKKFFNIWKCINELDEDDWK